MGQTRDATRTRQKIMEAALEEFAAHGVAGARVEAIALRAGVRKQLLYHYFPSKEALLDDVLQRAVRDKLEAISQGGDLGALMQARFAVAARDPQLLRLLMWEALEYPATEQIVAEAERRQSARQQTDAIVAGQQRGELPADFRPELLQMALVALASFPLSFPQISLMLLGRTPDDPAFQAEWTEFLGEIGRRMSPQLNTCKIIPSD